jgi:hypothetical protein
MAAPYISTVVFKTYDGRDGIQKDKTKENLVTITGDHLTKNDIVILIGASGTIWKGRLGGKNGDGSYSCKKLKCIEAEYKSKKELKTGGTEDISVTVTNPSNGTSPPVTKPVEIIVP